MDAADSSDSAHTTTTAAQLREKIASLEKRRETLKAHRETLERSGEKQLSLTDPDARAMSAKTRVGVGYNV